MPEVRFPPIAVIQNVRLAAMRVTAAVGEGSMAIAFVHQFLRLAAEA